MRGAAAPPSASGFIEITPSANNQVGAAWMDTPIDLNESFDLTLVVNLGNRDSDGADGLSIVFQNDSRGTGALGDLDDGGRWIGVHGIFPALVVELDTWYNTENGNEFGDRSEDHIGVSILRDSGSLLDHAAAGPEQALAGGGNLEDGADHTVRLLWNSATTTLTAYVDGIQRLSFANDIVSSLFGGSASVWLGVTGSTGGAYNLQQFKAELSGSEVVISKSVTPAAVAPGDSVTYTVSIRNNGSVTAFADQIVDQLPDGFVYLPGTTSGITTVDPAESGQTLSWDSHWLIAPGASANLVFQAQTASTPGIYYNDATVRGSNFAEISTGNTARVTVGSDLSTSTKSVLDMNGGDAEPNDTLQYTITFRESAGRDATAVSVVDSLPAQVSSLNLHLPLPPGTVDNSTETQVNLSNISVPANGSVEVVFDVVINGGTPNGTAIDNTVVISNPDGLGTTAAAPTIMVSNGITSATGLKPLYIFNNNYGSVLNLSRSPLTSSQNYVSINQNQSESWTLTPALASELTIAAGDIPVEFWVWGRTSPQFYIDLYSPSLGVIATGGPFHPSSGGWYRFSETVVLSSETTIPAGDTLSLRIRNQHSGVFYLYPYYQNQNSKLTLDALTVVNVDIVAFYDAPYPGGTVLTTCNGSETVYVRAVVSDPFGSFDISSAALTLTSSAGDEVVRGVAMTEVTTEANGAHKTYEYAFQNWPVPAVSGNWTARVTAEEGTEGLVRHSNLATLAVVSPPDIILIKTVRVQADPVSGTSNPKAIPGAVMEYTVTAVNSGGEGMDSDSVIVTDAVPDHTALYVGDLGQPFGPVAFVDGAPASGLVYTGLGSDIAFANDGPPYSYTYTPVPDAQGFDDQVTAVRINPKGVFNPGVNGSNPQFTLQFRVRLK